MTVEADGDDWLTVNVWSPHHEDGAALPVMVWIYGGAYLLGHAGDPSYDGERLAREGATVVVTFNYRVGIEGFGQIAGAPANRGLLDQVAALRWVRDNVARFGGDPANVTVFGESAGAGSVAALLAMPSARGLFHRAIAQSVPGTFFSPELAADIMATMAARLGLQPTVADLSRVPPRELVAAGDAVSADMASHADRWGAVASTPTPFSPVVDGDVLPSTPWRALREGAGRDVELIVGHNRDEFRLFVALFGHLGNVSDTLATQTVATFAPDPDAYRKAFADTSPATLFELVQSDWLFRMPSLHLAEAQVAGGGRAHVYELIWGAPGQGGALGACHGLDVPLVFGNFSAGALAPLFFGAQAPPDADTVSAHFRAAWTAFAATGDPGWPQFDLEKRGVALFDLDVTTASYPEEVSRELWQDHEFPPLPLYDGH
jgi:para-nitrobenzyl esterase